MASDFVYVFLKSFFTGVVWWSRAKSYRQHYFSVITQCGQDYLIIKALPICILFLPLWWGTTTGSAWIDGFTSGSIRYACYKDELFQVKVSLQEKAIKASYFDKTTLTTGSNGWNILNSRGQVGNWKLSPISSTPLRKEKSTAKLFWRVTARK